MKSDSLCGKKSCPTICVRVCHCPAGLTRSHWLAGMYRNRREMSRPHHHLDHIKQIALNELVGVKNPNAKSKAGNYGSRNNLFTTSAALLTIYAILLVIFLCVGFLANGPQIIPNFEPPHVNVSDYGW